MCIFFVTDISAIVLRHSLCLTRPQPLYRAHQQHAVNIKNLTRLVILPAIGDVYLLHSETQYHGRDAIYVGMTTLSSGAIRSNCSEPSLCGSRISFCFPCVVSPLSLFSIFVFVLFLLLALVQLFRQIRSFPLNLHGCAFHFILFPLCYLLNNPSLHRENDQRENHNGLSKVRHHGPHGTADKDKEPTDVSSRRLVTVAH